LAKKGLSVWLFSSLTFISLLHLIDATYSLFFNAKFHLLQLYPFINEKMQTITPTTYFWVTAVATLILWGITCIIAFENPVETFLNKILSDARTQSAVETQILEEKSEILDLMNETIESNTKTLAQVRDLVFNVRTEVKEIQPIKEHIEKIKMELNSMKKEFSKFKDRVKFATICPACGKPLLPEFKLCPYCGEDIKLLPETVLPIGK
jgi:predicted transcriptional regulator